MQTMNEYCDKKFFIGGLLYLAAMCLAMKLSGGSGVVLVVIPILIALFKNKIELLFFTLLSVMLLTCTNQVIAPKDTLAGIVIRSIHFFIAFTVLFQTVGNKLSKLFAPILSILLYITFQYIASIRGWCPPISYLKLFLFSVLFTGMFCVGNNTATRAHIDARYVRTILLIIACYTFIGSILLKPFPAISTLTGAQLLQQTGYIDLGSVGLFKGIMMHSQMLGPYVSAIHAILLADFLFSIRKFNVLYLALLSLAPVLIYFTSSRTAMGTYLASSLLVFFCFLRSRGVGSTWKGKVLGIVVIFAIIISTLSASVPNIRNHTLGFIFKTDVKNIEVINNANVDVVLSSRQGSSERQLYNFKQSPVVGNGFQVSESMKGLKIKTLNQVLSAPVEKGVWVTAILEEGGTIGMALFALFLIVAVISLFARHAYCGLAGLAVLIISNLGEFSMFSLTAVGGLIWGLIFLGLVIDAQRIRYTSRRKTIILDVDLDHAQENWAF